MQVGDLVKHKINGTFGTIMEVREGGWNGRINCCVVLWTDGWRMIHPYGQLEVVCKQVT